MRICIISIQSDEIDMDFADVETNWGDQQANEDREDYVVSLVDTGQHYHLDEQQDVHVEQEDKS